MKKIFLLLLGIFAVSCQQIPQPPQATKSFAPSAVSDEHLMDEVSHGLHKIQINDSTTILLYRGMESCTMIQLK